MLDFVLVNILNEEKIPWIMRQGPVFGMKVPIAVYTMLAKDPRINMEKTTSELAAQRKKEYLDKKYPKKEEKIVKEVVEETPIITDSVFTEVVVKDENDDAIDAILEKENVEMMVSDIANAPVQEVDADGMTIYTDDEISKMTKKQLKEVLESRGHAAGQRFVKTDDPFSPMYHDSVEELREKVKNSQQTF